MANLIQIRRDTAANWSSINPILAQGEVAHETDTNKMKVGDGSSLWSNLPYFSGGLEMWSSSVSYVQDDLVWYDQNNRIYRCLQANTNKTPPNNALEWQELANAPLSDLSSHDCGDNDIAFNNGYGIDIKDASGSHKIYSNATNDLVFQNAHIKAGLSLGVRGNRGSTKGMDQGGIVANLGIFNNDIEAITLDDAGNISLAGDLSMSTGKTVKNLPQSSQNGEAVRHEQLGDLQNKVVDFLPADQSYEIMEATESFAIGYDSSDPFGDIVYLDETSGRWELADADGSASPTNMLAVVLTTGAVTDGGTVLVMLRGTIKDATSYALASGNEGKPLYISTNAGAPTLNQPNTSGDIIRIIGYCTAVDTIYFNPSNEWITVN